MWGIAVKLLLQFSNAALITGINLLIHTTILMCICFGCMLVVKRYGRKAVTQSVLLRVCLVAVLLSPLTVSLFSLTGMNVFYLSVASLNPPDSSISLPQQELRTQSETQLIIPQNPVEPVTRNSTEINIQETDALKKAAEPLNDDKNSKVPLSVATREKQYSKPDIPGSHETASDFAVSRKESSVFRDIIVPGLSLLFTVFWVVFSIFLLVRFIAINLYIRRIRLLASTAKAEYIETCRMSAEEFGIKPPVILQSPYVHSTMITAFSNPVLFCHQVQTKYPWRAGKSSFMSLRTFPDGIISGISWGRLLKLYFRINRLSGFCLI